MNALAKKLSYEFQIKLQLDSSSLNQILKSLKSDLELDAKKKTRILIEREIENIADQIHEQIKEDLVKLKADFQIVI